MLVRLLEKTPTSKNKPESESAVLLRCQVGPRRESGSESSFENYLVFRAPPRIDVSWAAPGDFINLEYRPQGRTNRTGTSEFHVTENVATSVKPAQPWQLGDESDFYDIVPMTPKKEA